LESGRVSVIIPTYNRAEYLHEAVSSALQQTHDDLEVLVLDDASTDSTRNVVTAFDDPRIRYIRHPENLGPNRNWRRGIQAARGEFFCFLPDDDMLEPTFVERLVEALRRDSELVLAFCDHWVMDADGCERPEASRQNSIDHGRSALTSGPLDDFARTALIDDSIYIGAVLFRRAIVTSSFLDSEARSAMGSWILYECVRTGRSATYVPERLMSCRWHGGSVSRSQEWLGDITEGNIRRYRRMLGDEEMHRFWGDLQTKLAVMLRIRGRMHLCRRRGTCRVPRT
jgi:glycosyltransferase involved in cell wall biosynthesis